MTTRTKTLSIVGDSSDLPFLMRTGKVQQNASDKGEGQWTIPNTGFTSQLKYKTAAGRFKGQLKGYYFYHMPTVDGTWSSYGGFAKAQQPHMWLFEFAENADGGIDNTVAVEQHEIWLCAEGDGVFYPDLDSLADAALAAISVSSTTREYGMSDGDIVCKSADTISFMAGPVPWVLGWGYWKFKLQNLSVSNSLIDWMENPGQLRQFSNIRGSRTTPVSEPEFFYEFKPNRLYDEYFPVFNELEYIAIKGPGENPKVWNPHCDRGDRGLYTRYETGTLLKNYSDHAYYWQCDPSDPSQTSYRTLYDAAANKRLFYATFSGSTLSVGDVIGLGAASARVTAEGASSHAGLRYIEVEGKKLSSSDTYTADVIYNMPIAIGWMTGWFDYFENNPSLLPSETTVSSIDPYPLVDSTMTTSDNPVKIFRQLMGYPAVATNDTGVPPAFCCTTVADLFGYGTADRQLIDWDSLKTLIASTQHFVGVTYSLQVDPENTEASANEAKEISILQMLQGVCITHGIRMVWKYSEAQRSWILTFRRDVADTLTQAINSGRVINDTNSILGKPFEINGDVFRYCGIKSEYKRDDGAKEQFNPKDPSGMVQHSVGSKTLEVKDELTILPANDRTAANAIVEQFGVLTNRLAMLSHKIKLDAILPMASKMIVGENVAIDLEYLRNPKRGIQNDGEQAGQVESLTIDLGIKAKIAVEIIMSKLALSGISPSIILTNLVDSGGVTVTVSNDPADNLFANPYGGLTDAQTFFCYAYDEERGVHLRHTTCGAYSCYLVKLGEPVLYTSGANQNVYACQAISLLSNYTELNLSITGTYDVALDAAASYLMCFARRDAADLQPCQHQYYGFFGDGDGLCHDSNAVAFTAITSGG